MHRCIVCGRKFPEGQGIVMKVGNVVLEFHSKRCAYKFLRELVERLDPSVVEPVAKGLKKEMEERLRIKEERSKKKI